MSIHVGLSDVANWEPVCNLLYGVRALTLWSKQRFPQLPVAVQVWTGLVGPALCHSHSLRPNHEIQETTE